MTDITPINEQIQSEGVQFRGAASEAVMQTIGGSLNGALVALEDAVPGTPPPSGLLDVSAELKDIHDVLDGLTLTRTQLTGSGTYTVPANIKGNRILVFGCGGGGGGGGLGPGGGRGGGGGGVMPYFQSLNVIAGQNISYSVGAGGAGGNSSSISAAVTSGSNGDDTTFGSLTFFGGEGGEKRDITGTGFEGWFGRGFGGGQDGMPGYHATLPGDGGRGWSGGDSGGDGGEFTGSYVDGEDGEVGYLAVYLLTY